MRDFNNIKMWAVIKFFFLQGKVPKQIHVILKETLGEHAPSYATVKNWVSQFTCDFSTCDAPHFGWHKTMTIPEFIDQIYQLMLEDCQISVKLVSEQLGITRERVGSIIHEDLDMRKLSVKWVLKCLNADQKRELCQSSEHIFNFFLRDLNDFLLRLVTMDKTGYITMTCRQSNNQWSGDIVAHSAAKNSEYKSLLEKFSPRFFGIKTASSSLIIFQRAKLSTRSITHLCWRKWRAFWRKNAAGRSPRGSCSCMTIPRLTGHLQPSYLGF